MTTITLPPDLEAPLVDAAQKQGTTPELLAIESLRRTFLPPAANGNATDGQSLYDFLTGHVGTVSGTTEALSEDCGQRFADGLAEKQRQGRL